MPRIGHRVMYFLQSLAFFPGQPALVKAAAWLLRLSPTSPCELAWAAVAVSCMSTLGATVALYALTLEVRRKLGHASCGRENVRLFSVVLDHSNDIQLHSQVFRSAAVAERAAALFLLSPAAPFFTAAYTEGPFALVTFAGLLCRARYVRLCMWQKL